jgi:23S rRNA pseudouridine1911/1915/1917 synthase
MQSISDQVLVNNHHFIAYNKPAGVAVQAVQNKEESLEIKLHHYCKTPLFLIHRIDQPCSGIVLFAKKKSTAQYLSQLMQNKEITRTYLCITQQPPAIQEGQLTHYLFAHKKSNKSFVVDPQHKEAKQAILTYKLMAGDETSGFLWEIQLATGRHHQIRAQLGAIGCPILGDTKYGSKIKSPHHLIALHAWKMNFIHPVDRKTVHLEASIPKESFFDSVQSFL